MSTDFHKLANEMLLPSAAVGEVVKMASDHKIDLNSVSYTVGVNGNACVIEVGLQKTGNFILLTVMPVMITVGRYTKFNHKTVCVQLKEFNVVN